MSSLPVTKLGYDTDQVEHEFEKWQRERTHEARIAFDQMLGENSFVEFWGRLGKIGGKGVDESIKYDDIGDDGEDEQVDMKALAKSVDLKEIVKVLKVCGCQLISVGIANILRKQNDRRYLVFDHISEQREQWLRVSCITSLYGKRQFPDREASGLPLTALSTNFIRPCVGEVACRRLPLGCRPGVSYRKVMYFNPRPCGLDARYCPCRSDTRWGILYWKGISCVA